MSLQRFANYTRFFKDFANCSLNWFLALINMTAWLKPLLNTRMKAEESLAIFDNKPASCDVTQLVRP